MLSFSASSGAVSLLRLSKGADLLAELEHYAADTGLEAGWLSGIGALSRASLKYYEQEDQLYQAFALERHLELLNLTGNISVFQGRPMVHAHVTLADGAGHAFGGHLDYGTLVFAAEIAVLPLSGVVLSRVRDDETGLNLWQERNTG